MKFQLFPWTNFHTFRQRSSRP